MGTLRCRRGLPYGVKSLHSGEDREYHVRVGVPNRKFWFNHSSADGDFLASFSWFVVNGYDHVPAVYLAIHEGGHSLGIDHARSRSYDSETLGPLNVRGTVAEYGDPSSAMGRFGLGHYSARQKQSVGWLNESDVQTVEGNGTFTISPLSMNSEGLKALRIRRGAGNDAWLWVEYRQPTGNYESTLPAQGFTGALIHYEDLHTKTRAGTFLLDFTPNSTSAAGGDRIDPDFLDPALAVGKTWSDPYTNRSIEILSASSNGLTVRVNEDPTCVSLMPTSRDHGAGQGTDTLTVSAVPDCSWTVVNPEDWITITSPTQGSASATVNYRISANPGLNSRIGTLSIGRRTFNIRQAGTNVSPAPVSVNPNSGSGYTQTFSLVYSDGNGYLDLSWLGVRFASTDRIAECSAGYIPSTNSISLLSDDQSFVVGSITPGTTQTVENSYCVVRALGSSVSEAGNNLTLSLALSFKPDFDGPKNVFTAAQDRSGTVTGWQLIGTWTVGEALPEPSLAAVVDGAGFREGIAPCGIASLFGENLSFEADQKASQVPLPTTLAKTTVLIDDLPVPLFFVGSGQINFQVPCDVAVGDHNLEAQTMTADGITVRGSAMTVEVFDAAPGLFTWANGITAVAQNYGSEGQNFVVVDPNNPSTYAAPGDFLVFYLSGLGQTDPATATNTALAEDSPLPELVNQPTITVGGSEVPILYAGLTPGFVGLYQINVQLPGDVMTGDAVSVVVRSAGQSSNTASIPIQ